jgi:RNA polymerase sigma-70 factor (ECF subfamily)
VAAWARSDFRQLADREDVVAETCSLVILGIDKAYGAPTFDGFVLGHYFNVRRRARRWTQRPTVGLDEVEVTEPERDEVAPDEVELLERCLASLPPQQKAAVEMRHLAGASSAEIAAALAISRDNARKLISRGLEGLRACFERAWPSGRESMD